MFSWGSCVFPCNDGWPWGRLIVISLDVTMDAAENLWLGSEQVTKKENPEAKQRCCSEGADGRLSMTRRKPVLLSWKDIPSSSNICIPQIQLYFLGRNPEYRQEPMARPPNIWLFSSKAHFIWFLFARWKSPWQEVLLWNIIVLVTCSPANRT